MKAGPIDEKYINIIIRETLTALGYLHKQGIIHRDIKGESSPHLVRGSTDGFLFLLCSCKYSGWTGWSCATLRFWSFRPDCWEEWQEEYVCRNSAMDGSRSFVWGVI